MTARPWKDIFQLYKHLPTENKIVLSTTAHFANDYLKSHVIDDFRNETNLKDARERIKEMGKIGLLGPTIVSHGCTGVDKLTYGLMAKEIESVDSGYRSMFSVQSSLVMNPISKFGSEEQKDKYLPELCSGNMIGCFGLTEPNHGSDPGGMTSSAILDGNEYVLNASKTWITNAPIADLFLIWAKSTADNGKIRGFLVERNTPGLTTSTISGKFSLRTSPTGSISADDVRIPKANVLPNVIGFRGPFDCLNSARFGIAFGALGAAESCIKIAQEYSQDRRQFGSPLASKQVIQQSLANAVSEYNVGLSACFSAAEYLKDEQAVPEVISLIKRNSCRKSLQIARDMRDILGGNGISDEYAIVRHMLNLEAVNTYEGTETIHGLILGRYITGYPAF